MNEELSFKTIVLLENSVLNILIEFFYNKNISQQKR